MFSLLHIQTIATLAKQNYPLLVILYRTVLLRSYRVLNVHHVHVRRTDSNSI